MVISSFGSLVLKAHFAFDEYCRENHIEDPRLEMRRIKNSYMDGLGQWIKSFDTENITLIEPVEMTPDDKKRYDECTRASSEFRKREDKFVIKWLIDKGVDYDDLYQYCADNRILDLLIENYTPCLVGDRQCSFDCKYYSERGCTR